jgi:hypothetical protein
MIVLDKHGADQLHFEIPSELDNETFWRGSEHDIYSIKQTWANGMVEMFGKGWSKN